ncbi:fimbrial biogenesis chaperone [Comamonas composti]|uniref:fimbrial biogenesis chaperone n=1 Tax=Comamonas composti TaxID=408558 RepID=UPI0004002A97|nr:molecular chaperone [Comamonas composti]
MSLKTSPAALHQVLLAGRRLLHYMAWSALAATAVQAGPLSFDENRYFLSEGAARRTMLIHNGGDSQALVQISVDRPGTTAQSDADLPLAVSRPLLPIPANETAAVEVFYQGLGLPGDRESFFLLSVLDVPPKAPDTAQGETGMHIAARHRFKLFYRPRLEVPPEAVRDALLWQLPADASPGMVEIHNPSPYYATLVEIAALDASGQPCGQNISHLMVEPFGTLRQSIQGCTATTASMSYRYVSDSGREILYEVSLHAGQPGLIRKV